MCLCVLRSSPALLLVGVSVTRDISMLSQIPTICSPYEWRDCAGDVRFLAAESSGSRFWQHLGLEDFVLAAAFVRGLLFLPPSLFSVPP